MILTEKLGVQAIIVVFNSPRHISGIHSIIQNSKDGLLLLHGEPF